MSEEETKSVEARVAALEEKLALLLDLLAPNFASQLADALEKRRIMAKAHAESMESVGACLKEVASLSDLTQATQADYVDFWGEAKK